MQTPILTLFLSLLPAAGSALQPPPVSVGGGRELETCDWPSVVGMSYGGNVRCTGALIHPEIVLTAAHCVAPQISGASPSEVVFGESDSGAAREVALQGCDIHPDFDVANYTDVDGIDIAVCRLEEAVDDVPIVPPMVGCEADEFGVGSEVSLVGFGLDNLVLDANYSPVMQGGQGFKREAIATVTQYLPASDATLNILVEGDGQGVASGDSGGPGFVQIADGTWRIYGVAHALNPTLVVPGENVADDGGMYKSLGSSLAWIEEQTGVDVTPCHDPDGTPNPGPNCGGFPNSPQYGSSTWSEGCSSPDVGPDGDGCSPPSGEDGGAGDDGADDGATDDGGSTGSEESASSSETQGESYGETSTGTTGTETDDPGLQDESSGCACDTSPEKNFSGGALGLLCLAGIGRRKKARRYR